MDPSSPPTSGFHGLVNKYINVRTAVDRLQESVRAPGDEFRLPGAMEKPFFVVDNNEPHNTPAGAANSYFEDHPHKYAGKPIVFRLKTSPQVVMQATIVCIEHDSILYLRDGKPRRMNAHGVSSLTAKVFECQTSQRVFENRYAENDIEIIAFDGQNMSPSSSCPPPLVHTGSDSFSPGSGYTSPHAGVGGSTTAHRCGWCREILRSVFILTRVLEPTLKVVKAEVLRCLL